MPAKAPPPNRHAVEGVLPVEAVRFLDMLCGAMEIPRDRWHKVPQVRAPVLALAMSILVDRLRNEDPTLGLLAAVELAGGLLGVNERTFLTWEERWFRAAYSQ